MALSCKAATSGRVAMASRSTRLQVVARTTTTTTKAVKAKPATTSGTSLSILAKVEQLRLLSKVEELGLLSKLEQAGFTLSKIESSGLLSAAEKSGVLTLVADKNTPSALNLTGLTLVAAAGALVYFVPDDTTALLAAQAVGAVTLAGAGLASLVGASILADFQKA